MAAFVCVCGFRFDMHPVICLPIWNNVAGALWMIWVIRNTLQVIGMLIGYKDRRNFSVRSTPAFDW